mmetsp:Transcript_51408/g.96321  ORF Transcript_51408/g.96321 Transcript_51408/m.96321 type:complete len:322 (+) Transcript_51408:3690-4655(+)
MKFFTNSTPIASCLENPESAAACLFHSVTTPRRSTPKIGALAFSIMRERSSATLWCSAAIARICVMSCPTPMTPMMFPEGPRRVVAFNSSRAVCLPFFTSGNSKLEVSRPLKAFSKMSAMAPLYCSVMKFWIRGRPKTSYLLRCESSASLSFHSVTWPCMSTPNIGALAVWIKRLKSSAVRKASRLCRFSSVMSCPTPMTPTICPSGPRRGVAFSSTSRFEPHLVNNISSTFAEPSPYRAVVSTSSTEVRHCRSRNVLTKWLPTASSFKKPVTFAALAFHSVTLYSVSIPKIGAFAVSINRVRSSAMDLVANEACFNSVIS